jgi:hypothetical protein
MQFRVAILLTDVGMTPASDAEHTGASPCSRRLHTSRCLNLDRWLMLMLRIPPCSGPG